MYGNYLVVVCIAHPAGEVEFLGAEAGVIPGFLFSIWSYAC